MSQNTVHLSKGFPEPEKKGEGKLRLYSNRFCPFAQRARLILAIKDIPHEIVNIHLINKPEWYFNIHPEGKVPALDIGSRIIVESLDIANYLDETYPDPPLYPTDPEAKQNDKEVIKKIDGLTAVFFKCLMEKEKKSAEEWVKDFTPHLEIFENELAKRGATFFGGETPIMVDYMLWPWAERAGVIPLRVGQKLPFGENQFPLLKKWRESMKEQPTCSSIYIPAEKHFEVAQMKFNFPPDFE